MRRSFKIVLILAAVFAALAGVLFCAAKQMFPLDRMKDASSIGIIGGADGPTAIFISSKMAPRLLCWLLVYAAKLLAVAAVAANNLLRRKKHKD